MAEKYRIEFKTLQDQTCVVRFDFTSFAGASTTLKGAANPFVLRENNTDENWFKPVRPMMAEIQILHEPGGVSIDDFLTDTDNQIKVSFDFGTWTNYWVGWLMQDDFQEVWQYTSHVLILRASDGIGLLQYVPLQDNSGNELLGKKTPWELIQYAMYQSPQTFTNSVVINNLFHTSMTDGNNQMPLDQCYLDVKTFQTNTPIEYESSLEVLNKINSAFSQTIFQYKGQWYILRLEELYAPFSTNLKGFTNSSGGRTAFNKRFDVEIGANSEMKFITPEVIRFINRKKRKVTTKFMYDEFQEVLDNESFARGAFQSAGSNDRIYDLLYWTCEKFPIGTPTSSQYGRMEEFDGAGRMIDNFAFLTPDPTGGNPYLLANAVNLEKEDKIEISFDVKFDDPTSYTGVATHSLFILRVSPGFAYRLSNDGNWIPSTVAGFFTAEIQTKYTSTILSNDYQSINIVSQPLPASGSLETYLTMGPATFALPTRKRFKNLKIKVITYFNSFSDRKNIGIQSIFEKDVILRNESENEVFLDDGFSWQYKGNLFESDETTFTNKEWYRYRYKATNERHGFRAMNLIANWENTRFNRNKFDANIYGLVWNDGTADQPLGLINTVKLVDDDPNKVYGILNLKEINFSNSTWSATLLELYDQYLDDDGGTTTNTVDTNATTGTFNSLVYAKLTFVSGSNFVLNSNQDNLTYLGADPITVNITARLNGYINSRTSSPIEITLRKGATILNTYTLAVPTTPFPFAANLDTNGVTITQNESLFIQYGNTITQVQVTSGGIDFSYSVTEPFNYDAYRDEVINN